MKKLWESMTSKNNQIATWPYDPEIFYHLDYTPFIDLKLSFNTTELLNEAVNLLPNFVVHRELTQNSQIEGHHWKSIGLRTFEGDPFKTEYHTSYTTLDVQAPYKNTPFMDACPKICEFLKLITDIDKCDRIRIMLLEPGVEIHPHRDSQTRVVSLAVNISLNMPDDCEFWCDLNADGSKNTYSKKVPFSNNGSVILFNNAKYHRLFNHSKNPRLHIIFHGPIKFSDEYILNLARDQNQIFSRKELLKKLIFKKNFLGEPIQKSPNLVNDWIQSGLEFDMFSNFISIVVLQHNLSKAFEYTEEAYMKITRASLFPINFTTVSEKELDTFLNSSKSANTPYLVICTSGTFIKDLHLFIFELFAQINLMKNSNALVAGHILDYQDDRLPFFHEQFLILNWELWKKEALAPLGPFFSTTISNFIPYYRGGDIHDGYTPKFIKPLLEYTKEVTRRGRSQWGTELMKQCLMKNYSIINLSDNLRHCKIYSYPTVLEHPNQFKIKQIINDRIDSAKEDVYFFNNENLAIPYIETLKPTKIISVAAGFKSIKIFEQYNISDEVQITYVDFSTNALNYIKQISKTSNSDQLITTINQFVKILNPKTFLPDSSKNLLNYTIKEYFNDNEKKFFKYLNLAKNAHFLNLNIVKSPEKFINLLNSNDHFIIWVSNVFYNTHIFHTEGEVQSEKIFQELIIKISRTLNTKSFLLKNTRSVLFGKSIEEPIGLITDGAIQYMSTNPTEYICIY